MQTSKPIINGNWKEKHERLKALIDNEQVAATEDNFRRSYRIGITFILAMMLGIFILGVYFAEQVGK